MDKQLCDSFRYNKLKTKKTFLNSKSKKDLKTTVINIVPVFACANG